MSNKNYESLIKIDPLTITWFPTVALMLTKACGLRCDFCCEPDGDIEPTPLSEFKKIIDNLWNYGTKRLCLAGGDPLYYEDLRELTCYSKQKGFYNLLLTADGNRLLDRIDELKESINGIRFSVQGLGVNHDNFVKSKGSFLSIEKSINLLLKSNVDIMVSSVVTRNNFDEIFKIAEWSKKINAQKFYLYGLLYSGKGKEYIKKNSRPSNEEFHGLVDRLKSLYANTTLSIKYYDYTSNAECILIYGNGEVIAAPHFDSPNYRLTIGNILKDEKDIIWRNFSSDITNLKGYKLHLNNAI